MSDPAPAGAAAAEDSTDPSDTFQCGRCQAVFHDIGLFLGHKAGCCAGQPPSLPLEPEQPSTVPAEGLFGVTFVYEGDVDADQQQQQLVRVGVL